MINRSWYMVHLFWVLCVVRFLFQGLTQDVFACCFWRLPCAMTAPQTVHMFWRSWQPWRGSSRHFIQRAAVSVCLIFPPKVRQNRCIEGTCCQYKLLTFSVIVQLWMLIISLFFSAFPPHSGRKSLCGACLWEVEVLALPSDGPRRRWLYTMKLCLLLSHFLALLTGAHLFYPLGYNPMLL